MGEVVLDTRGSRRGKTSGARYLRLPVFFRLTCSRQELPNNCQNFDNVIDEGMGNNLLRSLKVFACAGDVPKEPVTRGE